MTLLRSLIFEAFKQCSKCKGTGKMRSSKDGALVQCRHCGGSGKHEVREADTAGADQLGSYRGVAVDDPFAARIHLADTIRKFADAVESVSQTPQFDPAHDTYDSQGIDGFIQTLADTQKLMFQVINFWKKRMANIDRAQEKEV